MIKIKENGFSLIEVMISLLLMGLMIYLFSAVQMTVIRVNNEAYYLTQATQQILSMKEKLFALADHQGLQEQIALWNEQNHQIFSKSEGVVLGQYPFYQIKLCWQKGHRSCLYTEVVVPQD